MRFLLIDRSEKFTEELWAGIPLYFYHALQAAGHTVVVLSNLQPRATLSLRLKAFLQRKLSKKIRVMDRDPGIARLRAPRTLARIRAAGPVDAIVITYLADVAYLETDIPIIAIQDSTWYQLLDYYRGYERSRLHPTTIDGGVSLDKVGLGRCAHIIYSSSWAADSAIRDYGADPSKVSVNPFGANLTTPPSRDEVVGFIKRRGQSACKILFLGKDWQRKGGDKAIAIAAAVQSLGVPVELHVVGSLPMGNTPGFVVPHGQLWKQDENDWFKLRALFEQCDFFVLPSQADCTPIVFSEAAAYGLPCLSHDTGGVKETLRAGGIALQLTATPADFARWIVENFRDRNNYERLALQWRHEFESRLNWGTMVSRVASIAESARHSQAPVGKERREVA